MILVTGATGKIGSGLVEALVQSGADIRVFVRDPARAQRWGDRVDVARGDLDHPDTIAPALVGIERLFMLGRSPQQDAALVRAATEAGVRHVVMLSSGGVPYEVASGALPKTGEEMLRASPLSWTVLHPYEFMSNALWWAPSIRGGGVIVDCSGSGRHAMIDPGDIAAVAAKVLTSSGHEGQTYVLTGPEAISRSDMARWIGSRVGKEVRHVDEQADNYREMMTNLGAPPDAVEPLIAFLLMVRAGELEQVSPEVERLTGRPPRAFVDWLEVNAAAFS
jgi:uncharacterized protein YbjT (DUF2867 family)